MFNPTPSLHHHPTFAAAEGLYLFLSLLGLLHATTRAPHLRPLHYTLLLASIIGGLGNDIFFAYLPIVDNFWHSQGLFMATPRFPFYIAAWYVGWLYFSTVFVWHCTHFKASFLTHAAMVSLLSSLYYAPWDVVGARYIWWTWHTSDQMFNHRWFGVPYASTMFTLVFVFCWSMVLHVALFRGSSFGDRGEGKHDTGKPLRSPQDVSRWTFLRTTLSVSCLSVPLLLIVMPLLLSTLSLSLPPAPPPGLMEVALTVLLLVSLVLGSGCWTATPIRHHPSSMGPTMLPRLSPLPIVAMCLHFSFLFGVVHVGDPTNAVSTGVHQLFGFNPKECAEVAYDLQRWNRTKYVCRGDTVGDPYATTLYAVPECGGEHKGVVDAALVCPEGAVGGRSWYSVRGKEKDNAFVWFASCLLCVAVVVHCGVVVVGRRRRGEEGVGGKAEVKKDR
jgi:hypothetical protein